MSLNSSPLRLRSLKPSLVTSEGCQTEDNSFNDETNFPFIYRNDREKLSSILGRNISKHEEFLDLPPRISSIIKGRKKLIKGCFQNVEFSPFNSTDSRFENPNKNNNPGVGQYNLSFENQILKKINKINVKNKSKNNLISKYCMSIRSIPSKDHKGYLVLENGETVLAETTSNSMKNNSLGPGAYDLNTSWEKNCLVWSKSSERKMNKLNPQKDDIYEGLKSMKESKKLENNQRKLPIRIMPKRNKIDNSIKEIDGISQFNVPEFLLETTPGPGYYETEGSLKLDTNPRNFQFFGSCSSRFIRENSSNPGPGSYFLTRYFLNGSKGQNTAPFNSNSQREFILNKVKENEKNIEKDLSQRKSTKNSVNVDKKESLNAVFLSKNKRFSLLKDKINFPGPGQYKIYPKMSSNHIYASSFKTPERRKLNLMNDNNPGIGSYNVDIPYSLNYNSFKVFCESSRKKKLEFHRKKMEEFNNEFSRHVKSNLKKNMLARNILVSSSEKRQKKE